MCSYSVPANHTRNWLTKTPKSKGCKHAGEPFYINQRLTADGIQLNLSIAKLVYSENLSIANTFRSAQHISHYFLLVNSENLSNANNETPFSPRQTLQTCIQRNPVSMVTHTALTGETHTRRTHASLFEPYDCTHAAHHAHWCSPARFTSTTQITRTYYDVKSSVENAHAHSTS